MADSAWKKLFGVDELKGKNGNVAVDTLASNDVVGVYFSAHWCPPCRGFTPVLAKAYTDLKESGKKFEIVFVSSDKEQSAFDDYFASMPWIALPFANREQKNKLSKKYGVSGIPSFVLLDPQAGLITKNGRDSIVNDPEGFPWPKESLHDVLGNRFASHDGEKNADAIKGKYLALYFSASWCPPCQRFTPQLIETYNKIKEKRQDVEFIFISGDKTQTDFDGYFKKMPFLALPHDEQKKNAKLNTLFEVQGIPCLVVVDAQGKTLSTEARSAVSSDPEGADFPWLPKPVNNVDNPSGINESTSLVIMAEGENKTRQEELQNVLFAVAEEEMAKDDPDYLFFMGTNEEGVAAQLRKMAGLGAAKISTGEPAKKETVCEGDVCTIVKTGGDQPNTKVVLFDIPDQGGYYEMEGDSITAESLKGFLKAYESKSLARQQLKR